MTERPVPARRLRLGLRREISILLPISMLVVIGIALFNLVAFRNSLALLAEERRAEAERLARSAASAWTADSTPAQLRAALPQALGIAILDASGVASVQIGELPSTKPPAELARSSSASAGLGGDLEDRVAGYARLPGAAAQFLRIDLPATVLATQRRSLRVLFPVVLLASVAALVLVLFFARHAFAPYDALLARARAAGAVGDDWADEIAALVPTFERALAALAEPRTAPEDDIAALERTLAPSLDSGVLLLDRAGAVMALNPAGAAILEVATPPAGTPLAEAFPAAPQIVGAIAPAVRDGRGLSRQEVALERGPETRTLGFTLHPLRRDDGVVRGYLALFADLTAARRTEEERRIASSLAQLGELTAGLAHEMRNSLATLRGYLTLIERRPEEEKIADYLSEIRRETDQLQRVLDDFLSFARPGSARLQELDLERLVRQAALDPALVEAAFEVRCDGPPPLVSADPQLLERAVRNLLHNAVEAQRSAGTDTPIRAVLSSGESTVELAIEDRGDGIPGHVRESLFIPFSTGRDGGVGLGLALAHRIVSLHGGTIRVEDRELGGTRMVISLPSTVK